jgi:hypothetical protein
MKRKEKCTCGIDIPAAHQPRQPGHLDNVELQPLLILHPSDSPFAV